MCLEDMSSGAEGVFLLADATAHSARVRVYFEWGLRDRSRTLRGLLNGPPQPRRVSALYNVFNGQTINTTVPRVHTDNRGERVLVHDRRCRVVRRDKSRNIRLVNANPNEEITRLPLESD